MKLWLDDVREPWKHGALGWEWVKTSDDAIALLKTGNVEVASLDHDLAPDHYPWSGIPLEQVTGTGYDVVLFLEANPQFWPPRGTRCHSMNPVGRKRMQVVIDRHYAAGEGGERQK